MSSDESDDEPLSSLVAAKKLNPKKFAKEVSSELEIFKVPKLKKKVKKTQKTVLKKLPLTFKLSRQIKNQISPPVVERPDDVWLYLKDFNQAGPYSCLLCCEWFISKLKVVLHYILNHKKDFCGICRYFVADREAWIAHQNFHVPWPCSQCIENFSSEGELRQHLSVAHNLVHCRLCHFRVPDNEQYDTHLFQKHSVMNVTTKHEEVLWEIDYDDNAKFFCILCSKSELSSTFFNHYMGFHHFTLKCFSSIVSGRDIPFFVFGANLSAGFIDSLKNEEKFGYVDMAQKLALSQESTEKSAELDIPEIKQEAMSDCDDTESKHEEEDEARKNLSELTRSYKGDIDFDVTLMELIVLHSSYFDYVNRLLNDINYQIVPQSSSIDYANAKADILVDVDCSLCKTRHNTIHNFTTHMCKVHSVKSVPLYSCRVCATTFENPAELVSHEKEEMDEFEDLWICQFCEKEFDSRESTRKHLTEHWDVLEHDNCFSPHLGFKCKFCPTLFWNETDRETHQVRAHFHKHKEDYYNCEACSKMFSDKVWFTHHYLQKHHTEEDKTMYLLKCCLCCIVLCSVEEMRTHFSSNHPEARKVFCSLDSCQYRPLSHRKSFLLHLRSKHMTVPRKEPSVRCEVCGREFPSARACSAHVAQVHGPRNYRCKICKETLHSIDERKLHYLLRHPGQHPFECSECGKSFLYKSSLYIHKQDHVPNKPQYTCTYCQKVFAKKDSFREHVQIHEGPRHACSYCPMRFVQRSNMLRHERRHTGERPYACQHCDRTFADKGACTSHTRTHSKSTSYACLYCGQTFVQKSKLTYHIRKHTGENLETCTVCSKLFTSACSLREHMKIHEAKKGSVPCPLCDRKYQDERYMLRHLRTSHTQADFSCPLCNKTLSSAIGLRHHVMTHSRLNMFKCKSCLKTYSVKRSLLKHLRRRHNLKGSEINIKDFYDKLEPRDCQLGLDEETMNNIFGPPKKKTNDILIADFVTFTKGLKIEKKTENNDEESNDDDEEENDNGNDSKDDNDDQGYSEEIDEMKNKRRSGEEELEPTDFVSVKIEPIDEDQDMDD